MAAHETLRLEAQRASLVVATHAQAEAQHVKKLDGQLLKALRALREGD